MIVSLILALVLMFVAIIGGIVYWIVVSQKRQRAEKQELTLDLGFSPVEDPGGAIASEIVRLHGHGFHQSLRVRNLVKRQKAECDVYLFDLEDTQSERTDPIAENCVAIASSRLGLPRFSVFPRVPGSGRLAGAANRLWRRVEAGQRATISVADNRRFDAAYFLAGDNESEIRKVVTTNVLDLIAAKPYRQIEAGRNMFTYDQTILTPSAAGSKERMAQERVAEALEIFRLLRSQ